MTKENSKVFCDDCKYFAGATLLHCESEKAAKPNWRNKRGITNPALLNQDNNCLYWRKK